MNKVKILLYCTKEKKRVRMTEHIYDYVDSLYRLPNGEIKFGCAIELASYESKEYSRDNFLNGKIVAECECDKVEKIVFNGWWECYADNDSIEGNYFDNDLACLSVDELKNYLGDKNGYALHLSNVKVFDKPKELAKNTLDNNLGFYIKHWIKKFDSFKGSALTKPPQNMCGVYDRFGNYYILISIQPQHLVKILNGEKTIEVRKKILNLLKELM